MNKLLHDQDYVFTAEPEAGAPELGQWDIAAIFTREAAKKGFRCESLSASGDCKSLRVGEDVDFAVMQGIVDTISANLKHQISIATNMDFMGTKYSAYPRDKVCAAVRKDAIITTGMKR